ncbi:MAG TPA: beta-phosphoglucomutase family hydrolase [Pseudonocardiaceae bacterium]|nr:beta-phosphoglucomutase family hydrolase [Pseudonocardiaceae bacterium]
MSERGLRLPDHVQACLFDLDGVLTQTAKVHAAAWQEMFDDYLRARAKRTGEKFVPFDPVQDYDEYVDGLPREDGTRGFLHSRGIDLPEGDDNDAEDAETIHALSERKNKLVLERIKQGGVDAYPGSVKFLKAVRAAGLPTAVVSSSANCEDVIVAVGIDTMLDVRVDGVVAKQQHLAGKPAPDTFLAAARMLDVPASAAAVFEDALAGVAAGRAGKFGYVIGVDRVGQADELRAHGADVVVDDLADLLEDR